MGTQRIPVCPKCGSLEVVRERRIVETAPPWRQEDPLDDPESFHVVYGCSGCGERFVGIAAQA